MLEEKFEAKSGSPNTDSLLCKSCGHREEGGSTTSVRRRSIHFMLRCPELPARASEFSTTCPGRQLPRPHLQVGCGSPDYFSSTYSPAPVAVYFPRVTVPDEWSCSKEPSTFFAFSFMLYKHPTSKSYNRYI
jgi:hypothetical protein